MEKVSKAQIKATNKYNAQNYDTVSIRIPVGAKDSLKELAELNGISLTTMMMKGLFMYYKNNTENIPASLKKRMKIIKEKVNIQAARNGLQREYGTWRCKKAG